MSVECFQFFPCRFSDRFPSHMLMRRLNKVQSDFSIKESSIYVLGTIELTLSLSLSRSLSILLKSQIIQSIECWNHSYISEKCTWFIRLFTQMPNAERITRAATRARAHTRFAPLRPTPKAHTYSRLEFVMLLILFCLRVFPKSENSMNEREGDQESERKKPKIEFRLRDFV